MIFATLSSVDVEQEATWKDKLFLSFDVDWASDEVLAYTIDLVEEAGVVATWFITHETPLLARLRDNPDFELGIHPNFNNLLLGEAKTEDNVRTILERIVEVVPEAKSVRCHSLTQSTHLLSIFGEFGLTHDSNTFIPWHVGGALHPWKNWNGITRVPYCWEDHVAIVTNNFEISGVIAACGIRVFDFHPIHVALDTDSLERYGVAKPMQHDWQELCRVTAPGKGVRTALAKLLLLGNRGQQ